MNTKRFLIASAAVFVFIFAFEWVWHGVLLKDLYNNTQSLWRPEADMQKFLPLMIGFQVALALILTFIFTRHYEGKGLSEGARYGGYIGVLFAVMSASWYSHLPIPATLAALWGLGGLLFGLGVGIVASAVYRS